MFEQLLDSIDDDYLRYVTHMRGRARRAEARRTTSRSATYEAQDDPSPPPRLAALFADEASGDDAAAAPSTPVRKSANEKVGRNEPCWCGSGKKFKFCHGRA